jgi:hypothetical protein
VLPRACVRLLHGSRWEATPPVSLSSSTVSINRSRQNSHWSAQQEMAFKNFYLTPKLEYQGYIWAPLLEMLLDWDLAVCITFNL